MDQRESLLSEILREVADLSVKSTDENMSIQSRRSTLMAVERLRDRLYKDGSNLAGVLADRVCRVQRPAIPKRAGIALGYKASGGKVWAE